MSEHQIITTTPPSIAGPPVVAPIVSATGASLGSVVLESRQRFISRFSASCDSMELLLDILESDRPESARGDLYQIAHRMSGLGGSVGFPTVSAHASQMESLLAEDSPTTGSWPAWRVALRARTVMKALQDAFAQDLASPPPWITSQVRSDSDRLTVLVVDDDQEQRALLTSCLCEAGHIPVVLDSATTLIETARAKLPSVILLDVNMPGIDGYGACQLLKADQALANIPIMFITTRAAVSERLAGLALGADEYLAKPVDVNELVLRLRLLKLRRAAANSAPAAAARSDQPLQSDGFIATGRARLAGSPASLIILRVSAESADALIAKLYSSIRSRDIVGWLGRSHLAVLFPGMTPEVARSRALALVAHLPEAVGKSVHTGVASSEGAPQMTIEALMAAADEALAEARHLGETVVVHGANRRAESRVNNLTILLADDDPEVTRIVDAHVRAAGYKTILSFDGQDAIDTVRSKRPDVLVLDLMLPKVTGFDVLRALQPSTEGRPRILVLSARSREDDVIRSFELGADDYMVKPFNPQELLVRIDRLLR